MLLDGSPPADFSDCVSNQHSAQRRRHHHSHTKISENGGGEGDRKDSATRSLEARQSQWKRIMLLVVAITVHNIPEGLAVGVSFGAAASSAKSTFHSARRRKEREEPLKRRGRRNSIDKSLGRAGRS
ncbi:unnamed protein product [Plutella xylostella]|uniref:(diamondback moth) hypothetical protein n=1 Tax=Plutella xylostella TaxID=51655 RepID=A0A8S4CXL8_PLUXY|nr:unnamed protein product [Plutella xylostella]